MSISPSQSLGNRWRWRIGFLVALAMLLGAALFQVLSWKERELMYGGSGPPVVVFGKGYRGTTSVECWDYRTDARWWFAHNIQTKHLPVVVANRAVAWATPEHVFVADLEPPHAMRRFENPVSKDERDLGSLQLIGLSSDEKYVIFLVGDGRSVFASKRSLNVYDLQASKKVHSKADIAQAHVLPVDVYVRAESRPDAGKSGAPPKPIMFQLGKDGRLETLADSQPTYRRARSLNVVRQPDGGYRYADSATPENEVLDAIVIETSLNGDRFVAVDVAIGPRMCFVGDEERVYALPIRTFEFNVNTGRHVAEISASGKTAVVCDLYGDIHVIDVDSGQVVARENSGTRQRIAGRWLAAAAAALGIAWLVLFLRETSFAAAIVDATGVLLLATFAASAISKVVTIDRSMLPDALDWLIYVLPRYLQTAVPIALLLAGSMAVGWYWACGRGPILARWLIGGLWLAILAVPYLAILAIGALSRSTVEAFAWYGIALIAAALIALVVVSLRWLGWTVADGPVKRQRAQFSVAWLMCVTAAVAIVLAIARSLATVTDSPILNVLGITTMGRTPLLGIVAVGLAIPPAWLSHRGVWFRALCVGLPLIALVAACIAYRIHSQKGFLPHWDDSLELATASLVLVALAMLLVCQAARQSGIRVQRISR